MNDQTPSTERELNREKRLAQAAKLRALRKWFARKSQAMKRPKRKLIF